MFHGKSQWVLLHLNKKNKNRTQQKRGPVDSPPVYKDWEGGPVDFALFTFFRTKVVKQLGGIDDVEDKGYSGLIELIRKLNVAYPTKAGAQKAAQNILRSLFPSWLPGAFAVMFSKPLPAFSARMNAYITHLTTYWLMGESELVDVECDGGKIGKGQGLLVKRCRYLEEAGYSVSLSYSPSLSIVYLYEQPSSFSPCSSGCDSHRAKFDHFP